MRVLRLIYGVTKREKIRNDIIRGALSVESVLSIVERNQLRWFGHLHRMPEDRDVKRIFNWKPKKKRPAGRPRKRWLDQIIEITRREEPDFRVVKEIAEDRTEWKRLTKRLTTYRPKA
ncbi:hypothetical protein Bbelb_117470 [Branchiostoma belcheri]|nr:hypothetical protein Bbelb_117470 [Branchiostoma belcheri]